MNSIKTIIAVTVFLFSGIVAKAQSVQKGSTAKFSYNADKAGTLNATVNYNSSFFVTGYSANKQQLLQLQAKLKKEMPAIAKLELTEMDDNTTLMIILDITAANGTKLTEDLKTIFTTLGVESVLYNETLVTTQAFKL